MQLDQMRVPINVSASCIVSEWQFVS